MNALSVNNISFNYGARQALDDISFAISPGETVILLGPNGAGKSTLFSLICGLFSSKKGQIAINGENVATNTAALSALGIVFQSQTLDADLTVQQNLKYFCSLQGIPKSLASQRIQAALLRLDLQERAHDKVRSLNGGHRRRVEIARATLHQPTLLLLDEPTVGLDIPTRSKLIEHIHSMPSRANCAVLWATHLVDEVHPHDRVIVLHNGRIQIDGVCKDLLKQFDASGLDVVMDKVIANDLAASSAK